MELIDSHCHLDVPAFDADREQVIEHCRQLGIRQIVIPGIEAKGWPKLLQLCELSALLSPALGLHPLLIEQHTSEDLETLENRLETHRPLAVGEIGLDFFIKTLDRDKQQTLFEAQLSIARAHQLPVILHVRKAHDSVLQTLKRIPVHGGIAHAFNGSLQQAKQYLALGFKLGFGGTLTYQGSHKLRALAQQLPLDALVLETDAPDMVVAAHRGERNSPEYLPDCLAALAEIRDEEPAEVARQTSQNTRDVLHLTAVPTA